MLQVVVGSPSLRKEKEQRQSQRCSPDHEIAKRRGSKDKIRDREVHEDQKQVGQFISEQF
jgi:hypothetical protein